MLTHVNHTHTHTQILANENRTLHISFFQIFLITYNFNYSKFNYNLNHYMLRFFPVNLYEHIILIHVKAFKYYTVFSFCAFILISIVYECIVKCQCIFC